MPNERHYNELNLESVGINLPYNMQAEQSVLGAVLLKPETLTDLVEIIRPEMFYTRQNAQIYSEMLRLFTSDQTIDFVTLLDAVISDGVFPSADEAKVYLTGLAETVPSISNVKAYAQIVQEKYLVRQLMGVAKDILQDAGDEPDADLLLENAEQRIYEIRSGRDSSALTPLSSSMVETLTNLQKISGPDADKYKGIPTGFRLLDTVLTGLGRGDLIILAARPGMGKTSFALNIATRVAMQQKVPVAIFSLEMTKDRKDTNMNELISGMVGRSLDNRFPPVDNTPGETILSVQNLSTKYAPKLQNISFDVKKGEIFGLYGLVGAGRTELLETIFGMRTRAAGNVIYDGKMMNFASPKDAMNHGFALITEERKANGLFLKADITFNTTIANMNHYKSGLALSHDDMVRATAEEIKVMHTKCMGPDDMIANLSGGNQQKVVIAKWLTRDSEILIFDEPTRSIDVGAKNEIYKLMSKLAAEGKSIIMISSEMPELLGMCDRIYVMSEGRLAGEFTAEEATQERIMASIMQEQNKK